MTSATDLEGQRRVFDELRHRCPPEDAEAALQEFLARRTQKGFFVPIESEPDAG